ncbi:hypothetical protein SAMN05216600_107230 [Pseudomonas cuatrocienegasensis]|uniref:Lipoprotein n=1 Tax=Pseudomonas cuatrocienegasensis TaxID=543360 RepID=A0ABY1BDQ4_9PSED|nr:MULTISPECIES: hypothetical protein [Pseudomonas]OEC33778.1 hypothetical protein A7D25_16820 [Pseudomonas sp. 21C1]SEQ60989.1 hypothetical protein SAMN05216600_107230 [Pseudomonas cuatrocienegasensis]
MRLPLLCHAGLLGLSVLLLGGCQSTAQQLLAEGYPVVFVEGFEAGCQSGLQAAGGLQRFRKDVPRYLAVPEYAVGWDDAFRQCQAGREYEHRRALRGDDERDETWREHVDQAMGRALRRP